MGNHEDNFLTYMHVCMTGADANDWRQDTSGWRTEPFFAGGGITTLASYVPHLRDPYDPRLCHAVPPEHVAFLAELPLYWSDETYIAVHAGVRPGIALERQHPNDLLRIRGPFLGTQHGLGKYVVFGHTPFREVKREADKIGIDTGACYAHLGYGKLTAFCLQTQQAFQVE
jgi:serine/threonine protein phosphatase 1